MRDKIRLILAIGLLIFSFSFGYLISRSTLYASTGIVTNVSKTETGTFEVDFETINGHEWYFYSNDSWNIGDIISITFDNKGTENITDDEIVHHEYSGTIEMYKIKEK